MPTASRTRDKQTTDIHVAMTRAELECLRQLAQLDGLNLSAAVRMLVVHAHRERVGARP